MSIDRVGQPGAIATCSGGLPCLHNGLAKLERRGVANAGVPQRIHIPPTANRWEAVYVAERIPLARGWLRQLESDDFELFDDANLTPSAHRAWLAERGVSYVAVPDADLDHLSLDEVALLDAAPPYLRPVWENEHWRLYRFLAGPGLVSQVDRAGDGAGPRLRRLDPDRFTLEAEPGEYLVRLRWTRYWQLKGADACAERDRDWTRIELLERGRVEISTRFSLGALLGRDRVCSR
jgi:hypothetical protein